uniref:Uncharacterized protein n=1 Tax=Anguilla anguilla TaxID=7936 RepID=A0A0E9TTG6_ANGAN
MDRVSLANSHCMDRISLANGTVSIIHIVRPALA